MNSQGTFNKVKRLYGNNGCLLHPVFFYSLLSVGRSFYYFSLYPAPRAPCPGTASAAAEEPLLYSYLKALTGSFDAALTAW